VGPLFRGFLHKRGTSTEQVSNRHNGDSKKEDVGKKHEEKDRGKVAVLRGNFKEYKSHLSARHFPRSACEGVKV